MQIALSTESISGYGLNRIFQFAKEAGFDGIDLAMEPGEFDTLDADYIKEVSNATKMPVLCVQAPKKTSQTKVQEAVTLAKKIGTPIVIIQPPKILEVKLAKWLKIEIPKIRQRENISIALENGSSKTMLGFIPENAMNSVSELKKFKHVCLDTSRVAESREDLIRVYTSLKSFLVHVHLSNVYRGKPYAPPEEGVLPLESFLSKLKQDGFQGALSLRVNPKHYHVGNEEKMLQDLKNSLDYCKKYLNR